MNKIYLEDEVLPQKRPDPIKKYNLGSYNKNCPLMVDNYLSEYKEKWEKDKVKQNLDIKDNFKTINGESIIGSGNLHFKTEGVTEEKLEEVLALKQDVIQDLENIREGTNKGLTSVQPDDLEGKQDTLVSGTNIKTVNGNSLLGSGNIEIQGGDTDDCEKLVNKVTEISDENTDVQYPSAKAVNSKIKETNETVINLNNDLSQYKIDQTAIDESQNVAIDELSNDLSNVETALNNKQDIIEDLNTIREGAAAGATAVQHNELEAKQDTLVSGTSIKTINGNSILGSGNLVIQGVNSVEQITTSTEDNGVNVVRVTLSNSNVSDFEIRNGSKGSKGDTGATGADGVSVISIEQISTSTEDEGVNVMRVTLSDDRTTDFEVRNGQKGERGEQGLQGIQGEKGADGAKGEDGAPGRDGADGHTPVKGVDYFTEAEQEAMAEAAAGMLQPSISELSSAVAGKVSKPQTEGTNGQVLTSNGDGTQSWQDISFDKKDLMIWGATNCYRFLDNKGEYRQTTYKPTNEELVELYMCPNVNYVLFQNYTNLKKIYLSNWYVNVTNANYTNLFYSCTNVELIDLSNFDATNISYLSNFLYGLTSLKWADFSGMKVKYNVVLGSIYIPNVETLVGDKTLDDVVNNGIFIFGSIKKDINLIQSSKLNKQSIIALFNGIGQLDEGESFNITLNSTVKALLSEEDIAIATNKGWTII